MLETKIWTFLFPLKMPALEDQGYYSFIHSKDLIIYFLKAFETPIKEYIITIQPVYINGN